MRAHAVRQFHAARRRPVRSGLLSLIILALVCSLTAPAVAVDTTWGGTGAMAVSRSNHTATVLPSGKVLVAGGYHYDFSSYGYTASCELYDPGTATWSPAGSLAVARGDHRAVLLPTGKVLVSGGFSVSGADSLATCELYDPATNTWSSTGSMVSKRQLHTLTLLASGKVLITGGYPGYIGFNATSPALASCEIYDPATGLWMATSAMSAARGGHTATLLTSGKVLLAGGHNGVDALVAGAEIYDPVSGSWNATLPLLAPRYLHTATLLTSGKVLVVAGAGAGGNLASCELFDPMTGIWSALAPLPSARFEHTTTLLSSGMVLQIGGSGYGPNAGIACSLYDPTVNAWTSANPLLVGRGAHTTTVLPSGRILVAGGASGYSLADCVLSNASIGQPTMPPTNAAPTVNKAAKAAAIPAIERYTTLTVLGADDAGEAGLTYTWQAIGSVPAPVEFKPNGINGTNAAKSLQVWMFVPGTYTFQVTIADVEGLTVQSSVRVTLKRNPSFLVVRPDYAYPRPFGTVDFFGELRDQFNDTFREQAVTWSATGGGRFLPLGSHVIEASGADIWGNTDGFRFVHQELIGDGSIIAHLDQLENTNAWAKAGLMMRDGVAANTAHAMIVLTPSSGASFQRRKTVGGASTSTTLANQAASGWLKLTRAGSLLTGAISNDGVNWTVVGSDTLTMGATLRVGLAVTSHQPGVRARAVFSQVSVNASTTAAGALPGGWSHQDVGNVTPAGTATYTPSEAAYTIRAAGADIWGTRDAFHFVHRPLSGDFTAVTRVVTLDNTNVWAKAGVMLRTTLASDSPNVFLAITPGSGATLQYRATSGNASVSSKVTGFTAPQWLRLQRSGDLFTGFVSADGVTWNLVASLYISLPGSGYIGLATTSHTTTATTTAVFTQLQITAGATSLGQPLWPWQGEDVGSVVLAGSNQISTGPGAFLVEGASGSYLVTATAAGISSTVYVSIMDGPPIISINARASASPVTGVTTTLSTYGDDDAGEPALTYTWSLVGTAPAPVTLNRNGTNAAKTATVTFTAPGSYTFRVTATDASNQTATSDVTVTVNPNTAFSVPLPVASG